MTGPRGVALALAILLAAAVVAAAEPNIADMRGWVVVGNDSSELVMATSCHRDTPAIESRTCDMLPHAMMDSLRSARRIRVSPSAAYSIHFGTRPNTSQAEIQNEDASIFHRFMTDDLTWYAPEKPGLYPLIIDATWSDRYESRQRFMLEVVANTRRNDNATKPDTMAERFFLRTILASRDGRIDRSPSTTEPTVFRLTYRMPDSLHWRKYDDELLRGLNARPMTSDDQYVTDVSITDFFTHGDTLIGRYSVRDPRGCAPRPFSGGATTYEMRALRSPGWLQIAALLTGTGDTFGCH